MPRRWELGVRYILSYLSGYRLRSRTMKPAEYIVVRNPFTIAIVYVNARRTRGCYIVCAGGAEVCRELGSRHGCKTVMVNLEECPKRDGLGCIVYEPRDTC